MPIEKIIIITFLVSKTKDVKICLFENVVLTKGYKI